MKSYNSETFDSHVSREQVKNIEEHCRKIHAEAVANSFLLLFSVPEKMLRRLIKRRNNEHFANTQQTT